MLNKKSIILLFFSNNKVRYVWGGKMYSTGIIKKIDNLGRIVLPKELRRKLKIRENDELEMYLENNDSIVLKKYSTMQDLKKDCILYADVLSKETDLKILFTDKEKVIVAKGKNTSYLVGEEISERLIEIINERMVYNVNSSTIIKILKIDEEIYPKIIVPLIADSKSIGSIILFSDSSTKSLKDKEYDILKFISALITQKLEI